MSADLHASSSRATLALDLAQRVPQPLDVYEIAAVIEASGITDDVARSDYGVGDVFALAERIFPLVKRTAVRWLELSPSEEPRCAIETRQMAVLEASGRGLLALVPLASLMAMLQGLAYVGWGMPSLLALSLGVSSAMLLTGGPIFAVGRRAAVYRGFGHWGYARRFCSVAFGVTFLACVLLDAAAVGAAAAAGAFTAGERAVFGVALAAAALVWLLMAGLA
ncbi:MAG TPA: hypothetical protein VNH40_05715, partial [Gaiellaceae bacterium]|nr:hypothetical protein [Gaiellaceae bacterium]